VKDVGCFSDYLGRHRKEPQEVSLSEGCMRVDIIIHELMHAIGFMHEFSRPDRDNYIEVNFDNIDPGMPSFKSTIKYSTFRNFISCLSPLEEKLIIIFILFNKINSMFK
jgi:hypothetical protein